MNILDKANIIMVSRYKRRSPIAKWGFSTEKNGIYLSGAEEDRTPDLSIANAGKQLTFTDEHIMHWHGLCPTFLCPQMRFGGFLCDF